VKLVAAGGTTGPVVGADVGSPLRAAGSPVQVVGAADNAWSIAAVADGVR
jgi:hypothetical protein